MNRDDRQSPSDQDQPHEVGGDLHGWEAISEWTGGIEPDTVEALGSVRELEQVYVLLHALVSHSPRDFLVRAAALEALVADGRASFSGADIAEVLYWLDEEPRTTTLRALRRSGWLQYDPEEGTLITDLGRWAYDVLSFLHRRLRENEILPTLAGVEYAMEIGLDPIHHLESMRSRLVRLREEMQTALRSQSEVILRNAVSKLESALDLSVQIRAVLDRIQLESPSPGPRPPGAARTTRRICRDVHDLLSHLHLVASDLNAAVTEVGRQYLHLAAGMTVEQVVRALMRRSHEDLAALGREALLPIHVPPPLLTTDVVAASAEMQVLKERFAPEPVSWQEPPAAPRFEDAALLPQEIRTLLEDLLHIAGGNQPVPLHAFVPRQDRSTSFLRASLLALAGERHGGEGITGQLCAVDVAVECAGDGWPEDIVGAPIARLTPGHLRPCGKEERA
jgi:hypothetical protein